MMGTLTNRSGRYCSLLTNAFLEVMKPEPRDREDDFGFRSGEMPATLVVKLFGIQFRSRTKSNDGDCCIRLSIEGTDHMSAWQPNPTKLQGRPWYPIMQLGKIMPGSMIESDRIQSKCTWITRSEKAGRSREDHPEMNHRSPLLLRLTRNTSPFQSNKIGKQ
nr:hypothetical protein Iba_chr08aCG10010 [Ipomoea batatas]GMD22355.1 hypothetical protein Iba_chr08aCG10020 [Ipomoea batatas]